MKKILFYTAATLTFLGTISTAIIKPTIAANNSARVTNFSEFPRGIRNWSILRHTLTIGISQQSNAVEKIIIEPPDHIVLRDNIDVFNKSEKKIDTEVTIDDKKAVLTFPKPIPPGTKLTVEMNKVKKLRPTNGKKLYKVFANFVGSNETISIGIARMRIR